MQAPPTTRTPSSCRNRAPTNTGAPAPMTDLEEHPSDMDPDLIRRIVEAALLASPQPLALAQLAALFGDEEHLAPGAIEAAIGALREDGARRGVELVEVASGFRFQVQADVHPYV